MKKFHPAQLLFLLLAILFAATVRVTNSSIHSVNAQTVVTPTLYCLGACPTTSINSTVTTAVPSATGTSSVSPGTSGTQTSVAPSTTATTPAPSTQPCSSTSANIQGLSLQHEGHHHHHEGGFLSGFFQFFLLLIELLLKLVGVSLPCSPTTGNTTVPSISGTPSLSSSPSTQPSVSSSTIQPSSVPTVGLTVAPSTSTTVSGCVAPAGMTALIDQDPTDEQKPWKRTPGQQKTTIYEVAKTVNAEFKADMQYGATQWSKSPCLDVKVVDSCPAGGNCYLWTAPSASCGDDGNTNAKESGNFTVSGGTVCVRSGMTTGQNKNVTVHEMGHTVGLVHRLTKNVLMNGDTYNNIFDPDATDYKNLLFLYGSQK